MNYTKTLIVFFKNDISPFEIPKFRGAIINSLEENNILFHNHLENSNFRYSYPLIQYKCINKSAAIVCIGSGTEAIGNFFSSANFDVEIGNNDITLEISSVKADKCLIQTWDTMFEYYLTKWLPLNQENYRTYCNLESIIDKYSMLEKLLTANILSFLKGINVFTNQQIICKITDIKDQYVIDYKEIKMTAFNIKFKTNVSLPNYIGLGKGVSLGNGVVKQVNK